MSKLQQRLSRELQQNSSVKIVATNNWCMPIRTVEVTYEPIRRSKMDVFMTMLLISIQEADMRSAEDLSELLLVDPLFAEDLVTLMTRVRLLEKVEGYYRLTAKGENQLALGIFEEELKVASSSLLYSPCHKDFLKGDLESLEEHDELPEPFRYVDEKEESRVTFEDALLIEALKAMAADDEDERVEAVASEAAQTIISSIISAEATQINDIPCHEFIVYDKEQDILYARIWNTLTDRWDKELEQQLTTREQLQWRAKYL
ncbi:MAG: hypothetical protein RR595_03440 [Lysinibacillus sp.]